MILAAGFGTRMLPVSRRLPKALLPVEGRTLLEWNLRYLAGQGAGRVVVNVHHLAEAVEAEIERLRSRQDAALPRIVISREPEILGTGGGVAQAAGRLRSDPVVLLNVDMLFHPDLAPVLEAHRSARSVKTSEAPRPATLVCVRDPRHAQIEMAQERVSRIHPFPQPALPDLWAYTGLCLLSQEAVRETQARFSAGGRAKFGGLTDLLREWTSAGQLGAWQETAAEFREAGSPEAYWEICRSAPRGTGPAKAGRDPNRIASRETGSSHAGRATGPAVPGKAGSSETGHNEESIVLPGALVDPGIRLTRCIIGPGFHATSDLDRVVAAGNEARPMALPTADEQARLLRFLGIPLDAHASCVRLKGDGSARTLTRVVWKGDSRIVVSEPDPAMVPNAIYPGRDGPGAPDPVSSYLYVYSALQSRGVRVAKVLDAKPEERIMILEDLGERHLSSIRAEFAGSMAGRPPEAVVSDPRLPWYEKALDQLAAIQAPGGEPFDPARTSNAAYDPAFVRRYEIGYFLREMVGGYLGLPVGGRDVETRSGPGWNDAGKADWDQEIGRLLDDLFRVAPSVLMHRDFQSRNLMVVGDGLAVIDFQGARLGPPEYDLASLLLDPYADLPEELRTRLVRSYRERRGGMRSGQSPGSPGSREASPPPGSESGASNDESLLRRLRAAGLCRLMQALGAFAYLGGRLGKPGFLEHAPAAAGTLESWAGKEYPQVAALAAQVRSGLKRKGGLS